MSISSFIHGFSGGLSSLIAILVWYPLEIGRFRLQIR